MIVKWLYYQFSVSVIYSNCIYVYIESKYMSLGISDYRSFDWNNYPLHFLIFSYFGTWWQQVTLIRDTQSNDGARSQYT
jgi:hypothetical protein